MPFFTYTAATNEGGLKNGQMEALDRETVIDYLKSQNLFVVSIKEQKTKISRNVLGQSKKLSYLEKISFAESLGTMIEAGVNLPEALSVMSEEAIGNRYKMILTDLKFALENGKPLSESLEHYRDDFSEVFINMVKAGEVSGRLDAVLKRLALQLKKEYALLSKIKNALIYPFVLICGVLGVLILIVTFFVPKLANIFKGGNYKLPWTTKILFALSTVASQNPYVTIAVIVAFIIALGLLFRIKKVRRFLNNLLFGLPVVSKMLKQIELVRFSRTTGELLGSGINIIKALEITATGMGSPQYQKIISQAQEKIAKGISLGNAFRGFENYFSPLLVEVITVGEKTGKLPELLVTLADFYEEQTDNTLKTLTSLIEPVLLVIVGILIGGMAVSVVVPIYQLIGTI